MPRMKPKKPKLPRARVMYVAPYSSDSFSLIAYKSKGTAIADAFLVPNASEPHPTNVAVLPCATRKEARAWVRLANKALGLTKEKK